MDDAAKKSWLAKILLDLTRDEIEDAKKMLDILAGTDADDRDGAALTLSEILYEGDVQIREWDLESDDPLGRYDRE